MTQDRAEIVALGALSWLIANDLTDTFLSASGADGESIRAAAGDPLFLAAVLDFVMMSDDWVQGVCRDQGLPFDTFVQVRAALPGGDLPNWT
ncbi:MAG: DUF3572 domain-containing protein [Jannaschia sp.]